MYVYIYMYIHTRNRHIAPEPNLLINFKQKYDFSSSNLLNRI